MTEPRQFTSHNYSTYNEAVAHELKHHAEIAEAVRQTSILKQAETSALRAKAAAFISLAVAVVAVAAAIIYWLLTDTPTEAQPNLLITQSTSDAQELDQLSRNEGDGGFGITKSFIVFDKTATSTGEIVVTAKEYDPPNLSVPAYQYCYLTSSASIASGRQIELAEVPPSTAEVITKTQDEFLVRSAVPLCTFILSASE